VNREPRCPGESREHTDDSAEPVEAPRAERVEEEGEAEEAGDEPERGTRVQPLSEEDAVEKRHPKRDAADEQRCDPGWNGLLRPGEASVPEEEERAAEDEPGPHLRPADPVASPVSAWQCPGEDQGSGRHVTEAHRQEGRNISNGDRDRHEGRAPDDVDRRQRKPDPGPV